MIERFIINPAVNTVRKCVNYFRLRKIVKAYGLKWKGFLSTHKKYYKVLYNMKRYSDLHMCLYAKTNNSQYNNRGWKYYIDEVSGKVNTLGIGVELEKIKQYEKANKESK